jgi:hypothetical protein
MKVIIAQFELNVEQNANCRSDADGKANDVRQSIGLVFQQISVSNFKVIRKHVLTPVISYQ